MVKKTLNLYSSYNLYNKFLNHFLKSGKKVIIKKIIDKVFHRLSKDFFFNFSYILVRFFKRLKTYVEIKKLKKRRRTFLVPIALKRHRRAFLPLYWLSESIRLNKSRISFYEKLYSEMYKICLNQNCHTLYLLAKNNKQASKNRINLHYRW
jgi:ribosomal protein S7